MTSFPAIMHTQLIQFIQQRIAISTDDIMASLQNAEFRKFSKGDYLLRVGEYCTFIGFLNKGLIVTTWPIQLGLSYSMRH